MPQRHALLRWLLVLAFLVTTFGLWPVPRTDAAPPPAVPFAAAREVRQSPERDTPTYLPMIFTGGSTQAKASFTRAFSDSRRVRPEGEYVAYIQMMRSALCAPTGIAPQSLTLAQAKANLRSLVESQVGAPAVNAYEAFLSARPAAERPAYAAQALAAQVPAAALLAFLSNSEGEPTNGLPLVSAAGLANIFNRPNEALALLDAADSLGSEIPSPINIKGRALALNNRGHALQALQRWADSEGYLRQAVSSGPLLAEAKLNLARALACQGKDLEAAKMLRAGLQRQPGVEPFDMSQGQEAQLPSLPYPESYRNIPDAKPIFETIESEATARENQRLDRIVELSSYPFGTGPVYEPHSTATIMRTSDILRDAKEAPIRPGLSDLRQAVDVAEAGPLQIYKTTLERLSTEPGDAADGIEPWSERVRVWRAKCAEIIREEHPQWLSAITVLDNAKRAYLQAAYRYRTSLVANLRNPYAHELGYLEAQQEADSIMHDDLVGEVSQYLRVVNNADGALTGDSNSQCWDEISLPSEPEGVSDYRNPAACPDAFAGDTKVVFNFPSILSISMNCEQVEFELSGELLGPFGQVSYKKGGEWTLFGGIKGDVPGLPLEGKTGFYIRGNNAGDITDAGFKSSASANLGVIEYEPFEFEAGVASAYEYLTSPLYQ